MAQCAYCGVEVQPGDIFWWPNYVPKQPFCSYEHAMEGQRTPKGEVDPSPTLPGGPKIEGGGPFTDLDKLPESAPSPVKPAKRRSPRTKKAASEG